MDRTANEQVLVVHSLDAFPSEAQRGVVTVGNFDGVHRGHAQIINQLRQIADRLQGPAVVFTFDPHPMTLLNPEQAPGSLSGIRRKTELLESLGVDVVVVCPTDRELLSWEPDEFFERVLVERLQTRAMVEGVNFRFGKSRAGDVDTLQQLCGEHEIELAICPPVVSGNEVISSSRVRKLIQSGEVEQANELLCLPYRICGTVTKGAARGAALGFPTANLTEIPNLVPAPGVYAALAVLDGRRIAAAVHIGPNPTFGESAMKVEVHLLDFNDDIYGVVLEVEFVKRLRGTVSFESPQLLRDQLQQDVASVRALPDMP